VTTPAIQALRHAVERNFVQMKRPTLLYVDATVEGVDVPANVAAQFGENLVLDLRAEWPMGLVLDDDGVHATLAFSGNVYRCNVPWRAIYLVQDQLTKQAFLVEAHLPKGLGFQTSDGRVHTREGALEASSVEVKHPKDLPTTKDVVRNFRVVKGGKA